MAHTVLGSMHDMYMTYRENMVNIKRWVGISMRNTNGYNYICMHENIEGDTQKHSHTCFSCGGGFGALSLPIRIHQSEDDMSL